MCCFLILVSDKDEDRGTQLANTNKGRKLPRTRTEAQRNRNARRGASRPASGDSGRRPQPYDPRPGDPRSLPGRPRRYDPGDPSPATSGSRPGDRGAPQPSASRRPPPCGGFRPVRPPGSRPAPLFPGNASRQRRRRAPGPGREEAKEGVSALPGRTDRSCRPPPWCRCRCRCRRRARLSLASRRAGPRSPQQCPEPRPRPRAFRGAPRPPRPASATPWHAAASRPAPAHERPAPLLGPRPRPRAHSLYPAPHTPAPRHAAASRHTPAHACPRRSRPSPEPPPISPRRAEQVSGFTRAVRALLLANPGGPSAAAPRRAVAQGRVAALKVSVVLAGVGRAGQALPSRSLARGRRTLGFVYVCGPNLSTRTVRIHCLYISFHCPLYLPGSHFNGRPLISQHFRVLVTLIQAPRKSHVSRLPHLCYLRLEESSAKTPEMPQDPSESPSEVRPGSST